MKKSILAFCLLMIVADLSSQSWPFDSIPAALRRRANLVVRSEQCLYTITDASHITEKNKTVLTLLNEKSNSFRYVAVAYDKNSRVNYLRGTIYDENGNIVKVLGLTDVLDMSAVSGGSFYTDDRMKFLYFPVYKFPFTIEYEYEKEYSSVYSYINWYFQNTPGMSVEKSGIQFVVPKDITFRFHEENLMNKADSALTKDARIYTWQEENIPAVNPQNYSVVTHYPWPALHTAPLNFEYGGIKGSLKSWNAYGQWMYDLIKGLDDLPQSDLDKVSEITSRTSDKREIARQLYEYMQSRTRYVSIQIGIGGMKPAAASSVAKYGFGDCKALVNYTMALLKAAGITSYYTLVRSDPDGLVIKDFVSDQFNHIILCVPMQKDTVWLECTNQKLPFNYLGNFTDDRYVLLITPDGGKLTRTPSFRKDENIFRRTGTMSLNNFGKSFAKLSYYYSGVYYDKASGLFGMASEDEMRRYLRSSLKYSGLDKPSVKFSETRSEKPSAVFSYEAGINNFSSIAGHLMTFTPAMEDAEYLQDIPMALEIPDGNISIDSITYNLPVGYKVEFKPPDVSLESEFGKFSYEIDVKNDRLVYKRYLEMNKGEIPEEKFEAFRSFINSIAKTDREMILLRN